MVVLTESYWQWSAYLTTTGVRCWPPSCPTPGATFDQAELRACCRDRLAPYKAPQYWVD